MCVGTVFHSCVSACRELDVHSLEQNLVERTLCHHSTLQPTQTFLGGSPHLLRLIRPGIEQIGGRNARRACHLAYSRLCHCCHGQQLHSRHPACCQIIRDCYPQTIDCIVVCIFHTSDYCARMSILLLCYFLSSNFNKTDSLDRLKCWCWVQRGCTGSHRCRFDLARL